MAIVNVTPDSFSDGGERLDPARAIDDGLRFVAEGADILDIGGESTRPGSHPTSPEDERRRILPVVEGLARHGLVVSIDTRRASVARAALDAGARIVNDISALRDDEAMLPLVAERQAEVILMHRRGLPENTFAGPAYADVVEDIRAFLLERAAACEAAGISRDRVLLDPGFGFGKSLLHNLELFRHLPQLGAMGWPLLVGVSRKSMLGAITGKAVEERLAASVSAAVLAAQRKAAIIRVHDVAATRDALAVWAAVEKK